MTDADRSISFVCWQETREKFVLLNFKRINKCIVLTLVAGIEPVSVVKLLGPILQFVLCDNVR